MNYTVLLQVIFLISLFIIISTIMVYTIQTVLC
jgi:hypothetical protein